MIRLGPKCQVRHMSGNLAFLLAEARALGQDHGFGLLVTHGSDGVHSRSSEHYDGHAADWLWTLPSGEPADDTAQRGLANDLQEHLAGYSRDYQVFYEAAGTPNRHVHGEWDTQGPHRV